MRIILLAAIVISASAGSALAQLPKQNDGDPGSFCMESTGVETALKTTGAYLPGATIGIRADPLRMWAKTPIAPGSKLCRATAREVPRGNWSWQIIERPANSTSQLAGTSETTVTLLLDRPGVYRIRFSACAFGCEIAVPSYGTVSIDGGFAEIVVRVLAIFPPDKFPAVPAYDPLDRTTWPFKPTNPSTISTHCAWDEDLFSSTWYTVLPWSGANDYKLLEGKVVESSVSSSDSFLNHDSNDWDIGVVPHPWSRWLMGLGQTDLAVEWERAFLPERMRPTEGDWVSAIGYWIYDCDHGKKTEIHPPVLLATQRPRAIALPTSAGAGSNVYVPGIVTDIWVNRKAGDITGACANTGLDQQTDPTKPVLFNPQGVPLPRCLPNSEGFSTNPINRIFTFNIYLPRSPQAIMAAVGKTAPPVRLFTEGCVAPGSLGLQPVCELTTAGGVSYLKVTIDLTNYNQQTYSGRIIAGWAHAAPDNWGARRWDVRVTSLDISDDGDTWSDGDWRFWVNTNNGESEWAKLFDCANCAHGNDTFDGKPWTTNAPTSDRRLGPSIVLFPNQLIWLATRGFESERFDDSIASLSLSFVQVPVSNGQAIADDGTGKYTMHYQVLPGREIGPAQISSTARARYNAYFLTDNELPGATHGPLDGVFNAGFGRSKRSPFSNVKNDSEAALSIMGMSVPQLRQMTARAMRENPAKVNAFFKNLKRILQRAEGLDSKAQAYEFLQRIKPAIPPALWKKHGLEAELRVLAKAR